MLHHVRLLSRFITVGNTTARPSDLQAAVQPKYALPKVPADHDDRAAQQPVDAVCLAEGPRAASLCVTGDARTTIRTAAVHADRQRAGRRHVLAGRRAW